MVCNFQGHEKIAYQTLNPHEVWPVIKKSQGRLFSFFLFFFTCIYNRTESFLDNCFCGKVIFSPSLSCSLEYFSSRILTLSEWPLIQLPSLQKPKALSPAPLVLWALGFRVGIAPKYPTDLVLIFFPHASALLFFFMFSPPYLITSLFNISKQFKNIF